ncbi:DUF6440 family protein [Oceanobacillus sp. FSL W8-0428]|uniref:DUF6440 family protein n=1 Tax=Oceanobacillus sp. FSL W8-0428 TaxID=2921715 RepID=UPI0030F8C757
MADNRFEEVYTQGKMKVTKVIRDNETGVLYMLHQEGYGAGLTVMVPGWKAFSGQEFLKIQFEIQPGEVMKKNRVACRVLKCYPVFISN